MVEAGVSEMAVVGKVGGDPAAVAVVCAGGDEDGGSRDDVEHGQVFAHVNESYAQDDLKEGSYGRRWVWPTVAVLGLLVVAGSVAVGLGLSLGFGQRENLPYSKTTPPSSAELPIPSNGTALPARQPPSDDASSSPVPVELIPKNAEPADLSVFQASVYDEHGDKPDFE